VWNCRSYRWASCTMSDSPTHLPTPGKYSSAALWAEWTPSPRKTESYK
jgi:hypothetical protein